MLDYTKSVFAKTVEDLKSIAFYAALTLQILQVGYLIYAICVGLGILAANIILLILTAAYLGFMLYLYWGTVEKKIQTILKRIYQWSKRAIKLFTLGISVYGLWITASETITTKSLISIILLVFMLIAWVLEVLFSLILMVVERRASLLLDAMKMDFEPVFKAKNFIDKIRGREVEEELVSTKSRNLLTKMNTERKERLQAKKLERKAEKAAQKAAKKAAKKNDNDE